MDKIWYFFGSVMLTGILIGVFETINPHSWPKEAVAGELLACWVVIAAILGREMAKEGNRSRVEQHEIKGFLQSRGPF
jgi:hypothetical protein